MSSATFLAAAWASCSTVENACGVRAVLHCSTFALTVCLNCAILSSISLNNVFGMGFLLSGVTTEGDHLMPIYGSPTLNRSKSLNLSMSAWSPKTGSRPLEVLGHHGIRW